MTDFQAPNDWFVYGDLHLILATPTLVLLSLSPPLQTAAPLQKRAAYAFVAFIVAVGVAQSYVWDAYGAGLGLGFTHVLFAASTSRLFVPGVEDFIVRASFSKISEAEWLRGNCDESVKKHPTVYKWYFDAVLGGDAQALLAGASPDQLAMLARYDAMLEASGALPAGNADGRYDDPDDEEEEPAPAASAPPPGGPAPS